MLFKGKFYKIKTTAKGVYLTQYKTSKKIIPVAEILVPENKIGLVFGGK